MTEDALNGGSSPLTRGKHHRPLARRAPGGLIPAHAGKTATACTSATTCGAHPRSRGENRLGGADLLRVVGSSPLTRGKRLVGLRRQHAPRLIPAHAGKTNRDSLPACTSGAHPRSRGENKVEGLVGVADLGSSPLTRGKRDLRVSGLCGLRLIPAHAGKTHQQQPCRQTRTAHPRSRGENSNPAYLDILGQGSSPLTRGKPTPGRRAAGSRGLIPAHAGKTVIFC